MGKEIFESRGLHGKDALVDTVKTKAGELDDLIRGQIGIPMGKAPAPASFHVANRCFGIAVEKLEEAIMWFTKGVSRSE